MVTAGPGTTHALTGVANAFRAEIPMLLIGGQSSLTQHKMGSLQDLPHVDMMQPITKFAATVMSTERCADMVSMAFRETRNGSFGPSFLEIPRDILDSSIPLSKAVVPKQENIVPLLKLSRILLMFKKQLTSFQKLKTLYFWINKLDKSINSRCS